MCDDHFVFMDSSTHPSLQQEGGLSVRGSLTELHSDLPIFILGFYLSLWGGKHQSSVQNANIVDYLVQGVVLV